LPAIKQEVRAMSVASSPARPTAEARRPELTPEAILRVLARGQADKPLRILARVLQCSRAALRPRLAELRRAGLVDAWPDGPDGRPTYVLSTLAAERLGLELDDGGHWVAIGAEPSRRRRIELARRPKRAPVLEADLCGPGRDRDDYLGLDGLNAAADPGPLEQLISAEETEAKVARALASRQAYEFPAPDKNLPALTSAWDERSWRNSEPPWPSLLIGLRVAWPPQPAELFVGIPLALVRVCGACLGRPLPRAAICLWCHGWGLGGAPGRVDG
jgi:hypothetical protein